MTPPDVAALLARHPLEWSVEDGGVVYEETVELPYVGHVDDIVPALTTALRAALGLDGEPTNNNHTQESHT